MAAQVKESSLKKWKIEMMKKSVVMAGLLGLFSPLVLQAEDVSPEAMQAKYPDQYQSWLATSEQAERKDMLASYPAAIVLWAGSSYAKEYHSPRGHHFAVADVTHTLRTGVAPAEGTKGLSASCWTCKSPDVPRLIGELGVEGFSAKNFTDLGTEMKSVVYCTDCHVQGTSKLTLPRPHAQEAMAKIHLPFDEQSRHMQGAQVCGQCHVTYYFQPERSNRVNIPWIFGSTADLIEKYYDTRRFYEWIHPISRTPIVKARHPEFEHWSRSAHAKAGVTCIDCHMPESVDEKGKTFTNHQIGQALPNYEQACQACHSDKQALVSRLDTNKAEVEDKARLVEQLLVKAHYEAGAAWDAGASWAIMNDAIMAIRHSQWRWDFAMSSHGLYAHNPQEGIALLNVAIEQATYARSALAEILSMLKVSKVNYPDISTKESAQKAVGIEVEKLTKEKQAFIEQEVDKHWPEVSRHGYQ
ncbi:ammonia-forming cytochrome c nitrite reductase subunit c552 [Shewanella sp. AS1]|uniref:ammonia-forming cytochrome c nitrite reductase subunit c552 n=1 Tax=Shewanella sp. AS1 TaxID=2907626 RepID=UPI001F34760B|nr:ammonia-forming cytochrome c nitrite reductase subunit c552 [Shewanella sp. AS1]MCE9679870.1 ammonia-forming cytochrome c nitrite reductase subunit c552 [Shewanella sp. AS1]